jgi:uncharacterized membrane protein
MKGPHFASLIGVALPAAGLATVTFTPLPALPGMEHQTIYVKDVNFNGTVIVGSSHFSPAGNGLQSRALAVRWSVTDGVGPLPVAAEREGASGVSADGNTIIGYAMGSDSRPEKSQAFVWKASSGMQQLDPMPGVFGYHASPDGATVVGERLVGQKGNFAWAWKSGSEIPVDSKANSEFRGCSGDGSVLVGSYGGRAASWTQKDGWEILPLSSGCSGSFGWACSAGGSVVVGNQLTGSVTVPTVWSGSTVSVIPLPSRFRGGSAMDVSADGRVVVGVANSKAGLSDGFIWTPEGGTVMIRDLLARNGISLKGWWMIGVSAISGNGHVIVGDGRYMAGHLDSRPSGSYGFRITI